MSAVVENPEKPVALIPLEIEVRGEVVASNVTQFRALVKEALSGINRDLKTDVQFGQAELDVKTLKGAEDAIKTAKEKALADAESLHALFTELDLTGEEIRQPRLELEALIKKRKDEVKTEIIEAAVKRIDLDDERSRRIYLASIQDAIKGKRTIDSMNAAVNAVVKSHNADIQKAKTALDIFEKDHGSTLTMDRRDLETKKPDYVEGELRRRLDLHLAREENKRLAAEAERAKAELAASQKPVDPEPEPPVAKVGPVAPPVVAAPARSYASASTYPIARPPVRNAPTVSNLNGEWEEFKAVCLQAASTVKAAREKLRHPQNQSKALNFSNALNAAWRGVA